MGVSSRRRMKSIFITFVAIAAVYAKSSEAGDNDGGIYFDEGEVALACTAGTAMGVKLADAMNNCIEVDGTETVEVTNRKKKTCRGRKCKNKFSKKCLAVDEIKKMIGKKMEVDLCIMKKLGWVDAEGKAVEEVMKADLMELPTEVSAPLAKDKLSTCAEEMFSKKNEKSKKCSEEEKAELKQLGTKVSGFKCFQKEFGNSCKNLVRDQIYNFYKQKMEGATTAA